MKLVPLTKGKHAMVDDEDFERVSKLKWVCAQSPDGKREYAQTTMRCGSKRVTVKMHRFILPHDMPRTDHRDGDGLNNQKSNLRPCDCFQNGQNRKTQDHSSPYKGVSWWRHQKRYVATIQVRGKRHHLGYFDNALEAAKAYDASAVEHFGEFAKTNFKQEVSLGI